jgi:hypothetical protein
VAAFIIRRISGISLQSRTARHIRCGHQPHRDLSLAFRVLKLISSTVLLTGVVVSCGPAKPVLVYVPPSIMIDTAHAPRKSPVIKSGSHSFWEAMANLDTGFVSNHDVTESQRDFARALGIVMSGKHEEAALALDGVRVTATDSNVVTASRILMTAMLQHSDNWKLLAELDSMGRRTSGANGASDKAGVESWAAAFRRVPQRRITFPEKPVVLPLLLSPSGVPMIEVTVEGKRHIFWLDTGSSMSILSSNVAVECGVRPLTPDTLEVATTTGRVPAQAGAIEHLQLGGINIGNTTALIVSNERMQVRIGDVFGVPAVVQIEGVVGYDIISRLDLRIDYVNHRVTMMKPELNAKLPRTGRNLFWVGTPVVRLVTSKGVPLHFNLDTGAQETYSTDGLVIKTKARTFKGERRLVGGLAGLAIVHGRFVDELRATMGGQALVLRKVMVFAPAFNSFVSLDGILGSDVGKSGTVRIDATNGLFLLESSRGQSLRKGS